MKYQFCTLFDKNYLFKGLALHSSLQQHCKNYTLWVLCMDDVVYSMLKRMNLPNVKLIHLSEFEDEELLKAKADRTPVEYCWTCTPSLPLYLLNNYPDMEMATYLDADLFFYNSPDPVYEEMGDHSILIIEHRYSPHFQHMAETSGIYNVELVTFRKDERGLTCANWWRDRCNEWCYYRCEDGKLGDQKYLDDWPERFEGVWVLQHKGAGLAPWNIERYKVHSRNGTTYVDDDALIFYHFHSLAIQERGRFKLAAPGYGLSKDDIRLVYKPYLTALKDAMAKVRELDPTYSFGISKVDEPNRLRAFLGKKKARVGAIVRAVSSRFT